MSPYIPNPRCRLCRFLRLSCCYRTHVREVFRRGGWWRIPAIPLSWAMGGLGAMMLTWGWVCCWAHDLTKGGATDLAMLLGWAPKDRPQ